MYMYICICICIYVYVYMYMYMYMYISISICICICIYLYVYVYIYMYMYMYIHIYMFQGFPLWDDHKSLVARNTRIAAWMSPPVCQCCLAKRNKNRRHGKKCSAALLSSKIDQNCQLDLQDLWIFQGWSQFGRLLGIICWALTFYFAPMVFGLPIVIADISLGPYLPSEKRKEEGDLHLFDEQKLTINKRDHYVHSTVQAKERSRKDVQIRFLNKNGSTVDLHLFV